MSNSVKEQAFSTQGEPDQTRPDRLWRGTEPTGSMRNCRLLEPDWTGPDQTGPARTGPDRPDRPLSGV